jgi:hypothetical protein
MNTASVFFAAQSVVLAAPQSGQTPLNSDWSIPKTLVFLCSDDADNNGIYRATIEGSKQNNGLVLSRIMRQNGKMDFKESFFSKMTTKAEPFGESMTTLSFAGSGNGNVEATSKSVSSKITFSMVIVNGQIGKNMSLAPRTKPSHIQINYKSKTKSMNLSCSQIGSGGVPL